MTLAQAPASMLEAARALVHDRGFSVIPLDSPAAPIAAEPGQVGKVPALPWKLFQSARPTDDNLTIWFANGRPRNLGIVTGALSGVVVVDTDTPAAETWAAAHLPETPMMTRTAKGRHRFYRHPGRAVPNKARIQGRDGLALDVRGDGGYVVAPGSVHASGFVYEREGAWPPVHELPVFDLAWLAPAKADEPPAAPDPRPPAPAPTVDRDRACDRARAYLGKVPGASEGQGGDAATYVVACRLVRDFGLDRGEALSLFREWNATCQPAWSERELEAKIEGALKYGDGSIGSKLAEDRPGWRPSAADGDASDVAALPWLNAGDRNLPRITSAAVDALRLANDPPRLFSYGGLPVRLEHDDHDAPIVRVLTEDRLRGHLARAAAWHVFRKGKPGEAPVSVPAVPPLDVVRDVLALPEFQLPRLDRIVEAPCFTRAGGLHLVAGYLPASRLFYAPAPGLVVSDVPAHPSPAQIHAARALLYELVCDFPFVGEAERAHAIALLLLPFLREQIAGATPLHLIEKPAPGTGATLLLEALLWPASGRAVGTLTEGRDEDEWRKRVTAKLQTSPTALVIDNLRRPLESSALSAAITAEVWEDRLLGGSSLVRVPVRAVFVATGNNPRLSDEITRRTIRIRLDARVERPWLRSGFRHLDLRAWVQAERGALIAAALTLGQAWIAAGRPMGQGRMGMFESWAAVLGGVLEVAGVPAFLGNLEEFYDASNLEAEAWAGVVERWAEVYEDRAIGVGQVWALVNPADGSVPLDLPLGDGSERSQRTRLGNLVKSMRGRVFGG